MNVKELASNGIINFKRTRILIFSRQVMACQLLSVKIVALEVCAAPKHPGTCTTLKLNPQMQIMPFLTATMTKKTTMLVNICIPNVLMLVVLAPLFHVLSGVVVSANLYSKILWLNWLFSLSPPIGLIIRLASEQSPKKIVSCLPSTPTTLL